MASGAVTPSALKAFSNSTSATVGSPIASCVDGHAKSQSRRGIGGRIPSGFPQSHSIAKTVAFSSRSVDSRHGLYPGRSCGNPVTHRLSAAGGGSEWQVFSSDPSDNEGSELAGAVGTTSGEGLSEKAVAGSAAGEGPAEASVEAITAGDGNPQVPFSTLDAAATAATAAAASAAAVSAFAVASSVRDSESPLNSLRDLLEVAEGELAAARDRSLAAEVEAQRVAERAIEFKDAAVAAENAVDEVLRDVEAELAVEVAAQKALNAADAAFVAQEEAAAAAEAELRAALLEFVSREGEEGRSEAEGGGGKPSAENASAERVAALKAAVKEAQELLRARGEELRARRDALTLVLARKERLLRQAAELAERAGEARGKAQEAEERAAASMAAAEEAVASEVEANRRVSDASKAVSRAEKLSKDIAKAREKAALLTVEKEALLANEVARASAALASTVKEGKAAAKQMLPRGTPAAADAAATTAATAGGVGAGGSGGKIGGTVEAGAGAGAPEVGVGADGGRKKEKSKEKAAKGESAVGVGKGAVQSGGGETGKEGRSAGELAAPAAAAAASNVGVKGAATSAPGITSGGASVAPAGKVPGEGNGVARGSLGLDKAGAVVADGARGESGAEVELEGQLELDPVTAAAAASAPLPKPSSSSKPKKSSRFFSASFFSAPDDTGTAASPLAWLQSSLPRLLASLRRHLPKAVLAFVVLLMGCVALNARMENRAAQKGQHMPPVTVAVMEVEQRAVRPLVAEVAKAGRRVREMVERMPKHEPNEEEASLYDVLWLLLASVVFVPAFQKLPGGSPVLGYLAAGALIGPYALSIIKHVHGTKALAEFGVVFLMFNIGLELSLERLNSMRKYVFGLGSAQVLVTAAVVGVSVALLASVSGPAALVIGSGLALSSTAVVLQVLQERGESTSRHGRATFSVLLFQDLAVVVLLILIPLLAPSSSSADGSVGLTAIAQALGLAAMKAVVAIAGIFAGGRLLLRPIYRSMAENHNAEIFAANTLLVVLGTSVLTAQAGLSMALGAFLAGLLLAETEFALQVESDINPYRGLLLGLFFMTVGMSIDPKLLVARFPLIVASIAALIIGKTALITAIGRSFGLSTIAAMRTGLLLAPGGEFAFVAFGEAVQKGIMPAQLSSLLFLIVGISMAITPWLAGFGQLLAARFDQQDVRSLEPQETETDDLQGHIIICGFGRVGQIIGQLLSERLIPFVALDVRTERVSAGQTLDLPVYFGDAGSRDVLHKVGAERAAAAVITLDTPGANYRAVWALTRNFPHIKTFVRAHDIDHGINLEKAGATAVVPETLEPSLQLAAAVLAQAKLPPAEIAATLDDFRVRHLAELNETSIGFAS
ncbi:hypothetical protein CLOM_g15798 [Closterium sp. NIES-68]|nr:hypothetical protein CLOM_g15798 [Closterium sp. NIES-68]GJP78751.1 hypothetical protein CLOP_g9026 [Closterium sp. NIES-67]